MTDTLDARTLVVWTARYGYRGPDRLDVTRRGADEYRRQHGVAGPGDPFAPSWAILTPALGARRNAELGAVAAEAAWTTYVAAYTAEMRASWRRHRAAWDALLARPSVTIVCFCADADRCHRTLLAAILARCGATCMGERDG